MATLRSHIDLSKDSCSHVVEFCCIFFGATTEYGALITPGGAIAEPYPDLLFLSLYVYCVCVCAHMRACTIRVHACSPQVTTSGSRNRAQITSLDIWWQVLLPAEPFHWPDFCVAHSLVKQRFWFGLTVCLEGPRLFYITVPSLHYFLLLGSKADHNMFCTPAAKVWAERRGKWSKRTTGKCEHYTHTPLVRV